MTTYSCHELHHDATKPPQAEVTFHLNAYDEQTSKPWGVLSIQITTTNGNGGHHCAITKHFLHGADWRKQAAAMRHAFRAATLARA